MKQDCVNSPASAAERGASNCTTQCLISPASAGGGIIVFNYRCAHPATGETMAFMGWAAKPDGVSGTGSIPQMWRSAFGRRA